MRILVTGACGFVGSKILKYFREHFADCTLLGLDNLCRAGSELNRKELRSLGVQFFHADVRNASDFESLPTVDWVIDAAANPSVLAGVDGKSSSRQVIEHNLAGTINMLEYCRKHGAGFVLLSTSRVYSVPALAGISTAPADQRFVLTDSDQSTGLSPSGVTETFDTTPPLSLYGVSKKMSEDLVLEYHHTYGLPVWINRCGVMAGAGQFGKADQGIIAFWIHSWFEQTPLRYLGFGGHGWQVRDCLHPYDLASLVHKQITATPTNPFPRLVNVSGGMESSFSLAELSEWCASHFGRDNVVNKDGSERPFDIGWLVLDDSKARNLWNWKPAISKEDIFKEVAKFAELQPNWMKISAG